jgi:2-polyprenyl-3-methyl-5-hydroxy-6-metoxy-1,4-benzoquinol methylase/glycosyltransferase involved in cell wall biosynthesis
MKLAYFSPLGPQRSGISDYSEELLPHLANGAELTLFVDGFHPVNRELTAQFEVIDYRRKRSSLGQLNRFDAVVYHMGNDHRYHAGIFEAMKYRSGVVVFHDFALQDFFMGLSRDRNDLRIYLDEVEYGHGKKTSEEAATSLAMGASPQILAQPIEFPLNKRIAARSEGIIVHSEWSRKRFAVALPHVPVARISMPIGFSKGSLPPSNSSQVIKIATFGLITPGKGIEPSLRALSALRKSHCFQYSLVGETNPFFDVHELVRRYGMEGIVDITGHISLEEFKRRIDDTDIAINIRERTVGETSASLCRLMAAGVCSIVSESAWYAELPNDAVVKIPPDSLCDRMLQAYLERLISDGPLRKRLGENARRYALDEFSAVHRAVDYLTFIREVINRRPRRELIESVSRELTLLDARPSDESLLHGIAADVGELVSTELAKFESASAVQAGTQAETASANGKQRSLQQRPLVGRMAKPEGVDYKQAAIEYVNRLDAERSHYLRTKPFYNLANKPDKHRGAGMDAETHRHFCDFANIAVTLGLPAGSRMLDVGCGSGWLSEYFARLGYQVTGIDISPSLIEMSRERVARVPYDVDHQTPIHCSFKVHDIEVGPLSDQFDAVFCYDSLHHFEDEDAVMRHIAAMLPVGGVIFILEGERPPLGSRTEEELYGVMTKYGTLESPFDYDRLRQLLDEHGFLIIGDYVSVNGLFDRENVVDDKLPLKNVPTNYHYLACKKVVDGAPASTVSDSRQPAQLSADIIILERGPERLQPGQAILLELEIENTGDTLWLAGQETRMGIVMPGVRIIDDGGAVIDEFHGEPPLPRAVAPGERIRLRIEHDAPQLAGHYSLKFDLVDQHICWFEDMGSAPTSVSFEVVSA